MERCRFASLLVAAAVGVLVIGCGPAQQTRSLDESELKLRAPAGYVVEQYLIPGYLLEFETADGQVLSIPFKTNTMASQPSLVTRASVYKPHEVVVDGGRGIIVVANERGGESEYLAGVTVLDLASLTSLAVVNIDEPGLAAVEPVEAPEPPEGTPPPPEGEGPPPTPVDQTVFMPIVLPPNSSFDPSTHDFPVAEGLVGPDGGPLYISETVTELLGQPIYVGYDAYGRPSVMAPMGAEGHARHPHGIDIDEERGLVYLMIEHSGLAWNADRTDFQSAERTDAESGFGLVFDVSNIASPKIVTGYLFGHGAHELVVNQSNGFLFQGNHEDSKTVVATNWVDVVNPEAANPYGFIDTGYWQALQDVQYDATTDTIFAVSHVGERLYALDGSCVPTPNAADVVFANPRCTAESCVSGENCIKYWVDLRAPLAGTEAETALQSIPFRPEECLPAVYHYHNIGLDSARQVVYAGMHSIHHAEHTGSPEEAGCHASEPPEPPSWGVEPPEESEAHHYNARTVVAVDVNAALLTIGDRKQALGSLEVLDLSHGYGYMAYPNVGDVASAPKNAVDAIAKVRILENSFVHPHWLEVDSARNTLVVTSEHTGNVGFVDTTKVLDGVPNNELKQVLPVSAFNPLLWQSEAADCPNFYDELAGQSTDVDLEPHLHGVQIDRETGYVYLSDEGEHCFYEALIVLAPPAG